MTKTIRAWHFTNGSKLRDGRLVPAVGETLTHEGRISICSSGLHASRDFLNALNYAPGGILHRVEVWGDVYEQDDKLVGRNRRILWSIDATELLREFAREVALEAFLSHYPEPTTGTEQEDYHLILTYLASGDESLRDAAWAAAEEWQRKLAARLLRRYRREALKGAP